MTKTVKKILLVVTCLMMFFCTAMFAACGGDKNCNHEYGDWKIETQATCTEKGLKTRICSKCNDIDSEEIPAEHKGTLYCSVCNKTLVDDKFSTALNDSFGTIKKDSGIEISISDISCYKQYTEYRSEFHLKNVKAFVGLDSNGELYAYGNVDFTAKEGKTEGSTSSQFILKGYKTYYYTEQKYYYTESTSHDAREYNHEDYGITDIAEELADVMDSGELDADDVAKILSTVISELPTFVDNDISALTAKLTESVKTGMLITKMASLNSIVDLSEGSVDYVLTKKAGVFVDLVDDFANLKTMDFIKKYLGTEVSKMISDTPNLLNKKVSVLQSELAENGITVDGIVALLDKYAKLYKGDQNATFESLTEINIAKTVNDYKDKTIVDFIYELASEESSSITKPMIENQVLGAITTLTAKTLPQLICEDDDDLKYFNDSVAEIKKMAAVLDETFSYNYVFAKDGKSCGKATAEFKPYKFSKDFAEMLENIIFDENLTITGEVVFGATPNASAVLDVDALIKKVSDKVAADKAAQAESDRIKTELLSYADFDGIAVKCEQSYQNSSSDPYVYIKNADGTIIYYFDSYENEELYFEIDGNYYYVYDKNSDGTWNKSSQFEFQLDYTFYNGIVSFFNYIADYYSKNLGFSYDEESKMYTNGKGSVLIEDGKLIKEVLDYGVIYEYSYDNINLTLPTVEDNDNEENNDTPTTNPTEPTNPANPIEPSDTTELTQIQKILLSAATFDGVAVDCTYTYNGKSIHYIKNADGTIIYYFDSYENEELYFEINDNYYYVYDIHSDGWSKSPQLVYALDDSTFGIILSFFYSITDYYSNNFVFSYDEESKMYTNGEVSVLIEDGKLIKEVFDFYGEIYEYSYDNINLTLPIEEENSISNVA